MNLIKKAKSFILHKRENKDRLGCCKVCNQQIYYYGKFITAPRLEKEYIDYNEDIEVIRCPHCGEVIYIFKENNFLKEF